MAVNILVGKQRYQARSDREREKLQATITTYILRHHLESQQEEMRKLAVRLAAPDPQLEAATNGIDSFIEATFEIVDRTLARCRAV